MSSAVVDRVSSKVAARQGVAEGIASYTAIRTAEDLKSQWTVKRLDEVCAFHNGLWKGKKPPYVRVGVIRNTNFAKDGILDDSDIAYLDVEEKQFQKRKLKFGDLILEKSGGGPKQAVGRVVLFDKVDGDYSFSNFTSAIRVNDQRQLAFHYLHKYLHWIYASGVTESMQSHSTGIRNLDGHAYKGISIAFPSLTEQQRIVAILDEAFADIAKARSNAERNLCNARELLEVVERSFFPSDLELETQGTPLDELCDLIVDCEHKTAPTQERGVPSIRTPNIGRGRLILDGVYRVSEDTYEAWTRRAKPQPKDLILAREAPAGNVAVIPDGMKVCLGQRTVLIRSKKSIFEPAYLAHLLLQRSSQQRLLAHSRGATVQHVNMKDIRAFKVSAIPPLEVQRSVTGKIAALLEYGDTLEACYETKLTALDELKQSLLDRAFAGGL